MGRRFQWKRIVVVDSSFQAHLVYLGLVPRSKASITIQRFTEHGSLVVIAVQYKIAYLTTIPITLATIQRATKDKKRKKKKTTKKKQQPQPVSESNLLANLKPRL